MAGSVPPSPSTSVEPGVTAPLPTSTEPQLEQQAGATTNPAQKASTQEKNVEPNKSITDGSAATLTSTQPAPTTNRPVTRSAVKSRPLGDALDSSDPFTNTSGLKGPVSNKAYMKQSEMARIFGLTTKEAYNAWQNSKEFMPYYDRLFKDWVLPRQQNEPGRQGPQLPAVQKAIIEGEAHGDRKYSEDFELLDKSTWDEVDGYAYTLLKLVQVNSMNRNGAFRGINISTADMEARLWQAILHQTKCRTDKRNREKKADKKQKTMEMLYRKAHPEAVVNPFADNAKTEQVRATTEVLAAGLKNPGSASRKRSVSGTIKSSPLDKSSPALDKPTPGSSSAAWMRQHNADARRRPLTSSTPGPRQSNSQPPQGKPAVATPDNQGSQPVPPTSSPIDKIPAGTERRPNHAYVEDVEEPEFEQPHMHDSPSLFAPQTSDPEPSHEPSPTPSGRGSPSPSHDYSSDEFVDAASQPSDDNEEPMSDLDRLRATRNPDNPFDRRTRYGKYLTIHAVAKNFNDRPALERLLRQPRGETRRDSAALTADTQIAHDDELDAIMSDKSKFDLTPITKGEIDEIMMLEQLMDNKDYQPGDYLECCKKLGMDPDRPQIEGMKTLDVLKSWQVTALHKMSEMFEDPEARGVLLADATGLGKTWVMLAFILWMKKERSKAIKTFHELTAAREKALELWKEHDTMQQELLASGISEEETEENPHQVPDLPKPIPPAKPKLIILLPELIEQFYEEVREFGGDLKVIKYHGDSRTAKKGNRKGLLKDELLSRDSPIFNPLDEANSDTLVLTSLATLRARHGPSALKSHRTGVLGYSSAAAKAIYAVQDRDWYHDLADKFDVVFIDEAHVIKNNDTASHATVTWLRAKFLVLSTASVLPNRVEDFKGYITFFEPEDDLWTPANLSKWGVTDKVNPFTLADDHPAAVLRMTSRAVGSYITGEDANENNSGAYLRKIWSKILIRRTYASRDPKDPTKFIGDSVASLTTRRLTCRFTRSEEALYRDLSENAYKNLITVLPDGSRVWNRKYSRELILNSTWLGWAYIGDKFTASTIKEWKEKDDLLWQMIRLLYNTMTKNEKEPGFDMPKRDDIPAQLAIICRGAPKIRATIRLLSELVLLKERKLVLWSSLPANQILLHAILQAVGIKNVCYSSEMNMQERDAAKQAFNKDPDCMVFDGSYYVGSFGLNLQFGCNHTAEFDGAPNIGLRNQARGRTRRVGQRFGVENYEITNVNSFQNRVVLNTLYKAVPGAMAELSVNIKNKSKAEGDDLPEVEDDFEEKELKIDSPGWYLINDELIQAPDPRLDGIAYKSPLTPYAFVRVILELARGKINNADPDWTEEDVDLNVLDDPALDNFDFEI